MTSIAIYNKQTRLIRLCWFSIRDEDPSKPFYCSIVSSPPILSRCKLLVLELVKVP